MELERQLIMDWFERIRNKNYKTYKPDPNGNLNSKEDYEALKFLDLNENGSFGHFLNLLRAMTHHTYKNAYFVDRHGRRIYVRVILEPEIS